MDYAIVGCDYAARHPEVGARIRSYHERRGDVRLLPCCRKDLSCLRPGDTVTAGSIWVPPPEREGVYDDRRQSTKTGRLTVRARG